jgi:hypothetical protein
MRLVMSVVLPAVLWPLQAWDTGPHQRITKAALDTLPKRYLSRLGPEIVPLVELYCMYPDRYLEMERFGFVRKSEGPRSASEIRVYCVRPDGQPIHGASGDRESDLGSVIYLFERVMTSLAENRPSAAARYAGVLSHFIADSASPPHSVDAQELNALLPGPAAGLNLHSAIERSLPELTLGGRLPRPPNPHLLAAGEAIVRECYAVAERNRTDLPEIVRAADARDEAKLNVYRLRAARRAAEIFADALNAVLSMAEPTLVP